MKEWWSILSYSYDSFFAGNPLARSFTTPIFLLKRGKVIKGLKLGNSSESQYLP